MGTNYRKGDQLVELASLVAYHGDAFLRSTTGMSRSGVESYWSASRNRLNDWSESLKQLETTAKQIAYREHQEQFADEVWNKTLPLIEEILTSEILTRVWTAIGCELDRRSSTEEIEPFVRSTLVGHLEIRHRLLRLVFNKLKLTDDHLRQIDQIRRRAEKWNDILLGYLVNCCQVEEFAFDVNRVLDFASSLHTQSPSSETTRALLLASLRSSFTEGFTGKCPNPKSNEKICEAILASFGSDIFDSTGQFQSLWEVRLRQAAKDTQGMIDCLASEHQ